MTARVRRGACASGKTRYRNRRAALSGIDTHQYRWRKYYGRPAPDLWTYRCVLCGGWHMTSMSPEEYEQRRKAS